MEISDLTDTHGQKFSSDPGESQCLQYCISLVALLKACATQKNLVEGTRLHAQIIKKALTELNVFIGNTLLHMYATCRALGKACQVFDQLPNHTLVSWNTLVAGYVHHGNNKEALKCLRYMHDEGFAPDRFTFACLLSACGNLRAFESGKDLHTEMVKCTLLESDGVLSNALVNMYGKCGALDEAQNVFGKLLCRSEVSWTALLNGFCCHGYAKETLMCFVQMKQEGLVPDVVTFACILKACASAGLFENGEVIHTEIVREGLLGKNYVISTALVDLYAKCNALPRANALLSELCARETVAWNALIAGCCQHGHFQDAIVVFEQLKKACISPDAVTYSCILKAYASLGQGERGKEMHTEIIRRDMLRNDTVLGNSLVNMYAKCGALEIAHEIFDELSIRDAATWTALLMGYCEAGNIEHAIEYFEKLKQEILFPDAVVLACILKACGSIRAIEKGMELHAGIIRRGLLGTSCVIESALLQMYVSCSALLKAQLVFDEISSPDVVSWNVLIGGYNQHGWSKHSIACFENMNCPPDAVTYASILKACSGIGALEKGSKVYAEIIREGLLLKFSVLGSALIHMYAKCGAVHKAQEVFDRLPMQDAVSWTALIAAYSEQGDYANTIFSFEGMINKGLSPDIVTFTCMIKACSNICEAETGGFYFELMHTNYKLIPSFEHHTCIVDLLGRSGQSDKAMALMEKMPFAHQFYTWFALLSACRKSGNTIVGKVAFEHVEKMVGLVPPPDLLKDHQRLKSLKINRCLLYFLAFL